MLESTPIELVNTQIQTPLKGYFLHRYFRHTKVSPTPKYRGFDNRVLFEVHSPHYIIYREKSAPLGV